MIGNEQANLSAEVEEIVACEMKMNDRRIGGASLVGLRNMLKLDPQIR